MPHRSIEEHVTAILNACWQVRHYARGGRSEIHRDARSAAIFALGLTLRSALDASEDFEAILTALVDGLHPPGPRF